MRHTLQSLFICTLMVLTITLSAASPAMAAATTPASGTSACSVVTLNHTTLSLPAGRMFQLYARVSPAATKIWRSSNRTVATVDQYGMVWSRKPGRAVISVTAGGTTKVCIVTVTG